jgi:Bacterial Ig domain
VRIVLAGIALSVPLAGAPSAWAVRYASPTGASSSNCQTPATACALTTAVHGVGGNSPAKGEEVIVEPGNYSVSGSAIEPGAVGMSVHGVAGKPRPVITGHTTAVFRANGVDNLSLGYLDIEEQGGVEALGIDSGVLERLLISGTPGGPSGSYKTVLCQCHNGTLRDSVIVALPGSTHGAVGIWSNGGSATETLYNDTIYSEAALAPAIQLFQESNIGTELELRLILNAYNTIAVNSAGGHDVSASLHGIIYLTHSDYASPTGAVSSTSEGGNVKAPPLFANAAAGDFRELVGSPTIDAGLNEPANGTLDFEGNPRQFGASTDIGAYEFSPQPTCNSLSSATAFGQPVTIQLQCADPVKAPLAYAIVGTPAHGTLSLTAATGQAVYTPAPGYSGPDSFSYDASSSHGTAAVVTASIAVGAAPVAVGAAPVAPSISISSLSQTAKRWREGNALAHISAKKKLPLGTTFSFALNVAARVTFQFTQPASGRKVGKKCVAQTKKNKNKRRCTRTVIAGTLTFSAHAGTNKVRFQGLISKHKRLRPGSYTLLVTAAASGKHSTTRTLHFTIATS